MTKKLLLILLVHSNLISSCDMIPDKSSQTKPATFNDLSRKNKNNPPIDKYPEVCDRCLHQIACVMCCIPRTIYFVYGLINCGP